MWNLMPRAPRKNAPGVVYHLISRFVDREWFITTQRERRFYLELLGRALARSDWRCLAFAVMSNHIHLAAVAGTMRLASWIRRVHSPFVNWMNRVHDRIGTMFVRGPKDYPVAPDAVGRLIAYIHNNPVRAGVVSVASASTWTSHRAYIGRGRALPWLHIGHGFAASDPREFDRWVNDPMRRQRDEAEFLAHEQDSIDEDDATSKQRTWQLANRPDPRWVVQATAEELGLPLAQLCSPRRGSIELAARAVAVKCAEIVGLNGVEMAAALGLSQQGVSVIHRRNQPASPRLLATCARVLRRLDDAPTLALASVPPSTGSNETMPVAAVDEELADLAG
jgi:hypothetical protein